jgi:hypothetical protein
MRLHPRELPIPAALLGILLLATVGTCAELVLLEHYEGWRQWIPLGVLGAAGAAAALHARRPSVTSRRLLIAASWALLLAGAAGVVLHLQGNLEFEREISPELAGLALWLEVARGATPALAPGSLVPFGLLGLLYSRVTPPLSSPDA